MTANEHQGSCQCGAVKFRARVDFSHGTSRCNCSICRKSRFWKVMVPALDFDLTAGAGELAEYRFASKSIPHRFCRRCGVKIFGQVDIPDVGPLIAVNVMCLDDMSDEALAALPVEHQDGIHDHQERAPEIFSYL